MVLPGHLSAGYLITQAILSQAGSTFSHNEIVALYVIGILSGDIPDIDILWFNWVNFWHKRSPRNGHKKAVSHRYYITHAPSFWLVLCALTAVVGYLFNSTFVEYMAALIFLGSWSHLSLDSIDHGVMWLWPFSTRRFYLFNPPENRQPQGSMVTYYWSWLSGPYFTEVTAYAEILLTLIALWVLFH